MTSVKAAATPAIVHVTARCGGTGLSQSPMRMPPTTTVATQTTTTLTATQTAHATTAGTASPSAVDEAASGALHAVSRGVGLSTNCRAGVVPGM